MNCTLIRRITLGFLLLAGGCSNAFKFDKSTRIDGDHSKLTSAQSSTLSWAEGQLATALTRRTGWEWKVSGCLFSNYTSQRVPKGTIFFVYDRDLGNGVYHLSVKPDHILIKASSSEGFKKATKAILNNIREKDGKFFVPLL